jgi:hypothetical protein
MVWADDDVHKLVEQIIASSREGRDVDLTPEGVNIVLAALRAYLDKLASPSSTAAIVGFQVEALDELGLLREVLVATVDEGVARSTLAKAKNQFPNQKIVLRARTMSGERIDRESSGPCYGTVREILNRSDLASQGADHRRHRVSPLPCIWAPSVRRASSE